MAKSTPTTRGGARPGAGRKSVDGVQRPTQRLVMLDDETVAKAREMGEGELSAGLRKAVRLASDAEPVR